MRIFLVVLSFMIFSGFSGVTWKEGFTEVAMSDDEDCTLIDVEKNYPVSSDRIGVFRDGKITWFGGEIKGKVEWVCDKDKTI